MAESVIKGKVRGIVPLLGCKLKVIDAADLTGGTLYGEFRSDIESIIIYANIPNHMLRQVLTHELFHAFLHLSGFSHTIGELMGEHAEEHLTLVFEHAFGKRVVFPAKIETWIKEIGE